MKQEEPRFLLSVLCCSSASEQLAVAPDAAFWLLWKRKRGREGEGERRNQIIAKGGF